MTSVIYPGQGSQFLGMGKDFFDNFKEAKETFEEIEEATKIDLKKVIFGDDSRILNTTKYTQISIFTASIVIYKTLETNFGFGSGSYNISHMLGHSLGEYSALAASKAISISQASKLLKKRGDLMNSAVEPNSTSMAALIGMNCMDIEKIIKTHDLKVEIANDNSPGQVVISGANLDLQNSEKVFILNGLKKFVKLNVSAAFHSKFMSEAQKDLGLEIDKLNFNEPSCGIISNYDASVNSSTKNIITALKFQMSNRVRWTESILKLEQTGEKNIVEIGPGKVLSGLVKRISKNFDIVSINNLEDLKKIN